MRAEVAALSIGCVARLSLGHLFIPSNLEQPELLVKEFHGQDGWRYPAQNVESLRDVRDDSTFSGGALFRHMYVRTHHILAGIPVEAKGLGVSRRV